MTGSLIGFLPLIGWHKSDFKGDCFFLTVMDYNYLVFLYFGTIITPALLLAAFYAHIYRVVLKQLRQIVTMNPENGTSASGSSSGGTMLRMLGAAQKREVKATQNLAIIVLFFMICWIPLYTINCVIAFSNDVHINPTFMLFCIILSHLNSAGNPLLYAYHLRDFRAALKNFLCQLFGYTEHVDHQPNLNRNSLASNTYSTRRRLQSMRSKNKRNSTDIEGKTYHFNNSMLYYRNKTDNNLTGTPKANNVIKNSTAVAVVPSSGGELNKDIWKIPECSSESSDSFKESSHDKTSMVRPATPYRIRIQSDSINPAFLDNSSLEDDFDDVFIEDDDLCNEDDKTECKTTEFSLSNHSFSAVRTKCLSTSSPQLSRSIFVVEDLRDSPKFLRSCSLVEQKTKAEPLPRESRYSALKRLALSPNRVFKKGARSKSISDDGSCSTDSITKKNNETIVKSCGS